MGAAETITVLTSASSTAWEQPTVRLRWFQPHPTYVPVLQQWIEMKTEKDGCISIFGRWQNVPTETT